MQFFKRKQMEVELMDMDIGPPAAVNIWKEVTGGGMAVDYLNWLAAQFEIYRTASIEGLRLEANLAAKVEGNQILSQMREPFVYWLSRRFF